MLYNTLQITLLNHFPLTLFPSFRFIRSICWRKSPVTFRTWALLLYHGVPIGKTPSHPHHHPYTPVPLPTPPTTRPRDRPWTFLTRKPGGGVGWWKRRRRRRNKEVVKYRIMKRRSRRLANRSKKRKIVKFDAFELYWRWKMRLAGIGTNRRRREAEENSVEEKSEGRHQELILEKRGRRETGEGKLEVIPEWSSEGETSEKGEGEYRIESENTLLYPRKEQEGTRKERRDASNNERIEWTDRRRGRGRERERGGGGGHRERERERGGRERERGGRGQGNQANPNQQNNIELDYRPSIGDVVEATSQEPTFAWGGNATIQGVKQMLGLYSNDNHTIAFPCDALGPAGYYSVRLVAPELTTESARLIVSSLWFKVREKNQNK